MAFAIIRLADPVRYFGAVIEAVELLRANWRLALMMARRDLTSRHANQFIGSFWIIGHPLFQMLIFVFLFGIVFKQQIGGSYEMPRDYTVYILSGLVAWLSILPVLTTTCVSITSNAALVRQFNFEVEILPIKDVISGMVFWFVGVLVIVAYQLVVYRTLPWTVILLPVVLLIHVTLMVGTAWALSALTVYFRDIKDIMTVLGALGVYLLPVVYLPSWMPPAFRPLVYANPLSYPIWIYQDTLYFGRIEHPWSWVFSAAIAFVVFAAGHRLFQRLKPAFGTVL
jgi:lipopolysaccharide transport system permease protein